MLHTEVIEASTTEVLRLQATSETFDDLAIFYGRWANDGGVRMTDDELRGALTALALLWRRSGAWGLGTKFLEMLGETGALLTKVNRNRVLTASEEKQILEMLEAISQDDPDEGDEEGGASDAAAV